MKVSYVLAILLVILVVVSATRYEKHQGKRPGKLNARQEWERFKTKYSRMYASDDEESRRFSIFKENLKLARQKTARSPKATFGVTKFSDLTLDEFKSMFLMNVSRTISKAPIAPKISNVQLPSSFDWSSKGAVTAVKDQGQCGSCWDFSATETIESVCFLAGYPLNTLSEQQILDCDTTDSGCNGGWPYDAYQYVISAGGLESESAYPYTAQDGSCQFNPSDVQCKVASWQYVTQDQDENQIQSFLYANSPLSVCVDASSWSSYTGGVVTASDCGTDIDHCVQMTGFQPMGGTNVYNIRNSWGSDWGVNGYIYLEIGSDTCAVAQVVTVPCVTSQSGQNVC